MVVLIALAWRAAFLSVVGWGVASYTHSVPLAFAAAAACWVLMPNLNER